MDAAVTELTVLWPLAVYFGAVLVVVAGMLGISFVLGQRHNDPATGDPYEAGIKPTGSARLRLSVNYYVVAMLFVIFDLEVAFIVAWAIAFKEVGLAGYIGVLVFIGVLAAALVYEWKQGALDWGALKKQARFRTNIPEYNPPPPERTENSDAMVVQ